MKTFREYVNWLKSIKDFSNPGEIVRKIERPDKGFKGCNFLTFHNYAAFLSGDPRDISEILLDSGFNKTGSQESEKDFGGEIGNQALLQDGYDQFSLDHNYRKDRGHICNVMLPRTEVPKLPWYTPEEVASMIPYRVPEGRSKESFKVHNKLDFMSPGYEQPENLERIRDAKIKLLERIMDKGIKGLMGSKGYFVINNPKD